MDNLWAPWRMQYVRAPKKDAGETFLKKLEDGNDEENLVLFRGRHSFVCMNLYPYNNGHIMILPNNIVEKPEELDDATQFEIMKIASLSMKIIRENLDVNEFKFLKDELIQGNTDDKFLQKQKLENINLSERLKKLGRNEGRVLDVSQKKFAVTPWFSVMVNENKLRNLNEKDIDTLLEALSNSLKKNLKRK